MVVRLSQIFFFHEVEDVLNTSLTLGNEEPLTQTLLEIAVLRITDILIKLGQAMTQLVLRKLIQFLP
jgi:hypothetical protein